MELNKSKEPKITKAEDVIKLFELLGSEGIEAWLDGGWGVDALLGRQTRPHADVDIVIQEKDVPRLRSLLEERGYLDVERDDTSLWNFVLGDAQGHEVDVHAIVLDRHGNGIYGPAERGVMFPAASLTGKGHINEYSVKCISPEYVVKFHSGYELKEKDFQDVSALCQKFGIALPEEYARF